MSCLQARPRLVPAIRYDEHVIREQSQLMRLNPLEKDLYERLSVSIHQKNS